MLDPEFIQWAATLGVGGILAAFMFAFYRKDIKQYTDLWKSTADMLMGTVKENTASNIKLISLIEGMERNRMRKADIDDMIDKRVREKDNPPERRASAD